MARRIRAARHYAGLSKDQLGELIDRSANQVGRYERGEWSRQPDINLLRGIAIATGVPLEFLVSGFEGLSALADDALDALSQPTPPAAPE